jgi:hypothetical protein
VTSNILIPISSRLAKQKEMSAVVGGGALTPREVHILVTIERIGGSLSMVAILMIILFYACFQKLRTTPNLFLVLAAIANACASVASVMGYDGLFQGKTSALCQAQAFIFQW